MKHLMRRSIIRATRSTSKICDAGYVLPAVLVVLALVFTLGMAYLRNAQVSLEMSRAYLAHENAVTIADSATAICRGRLSEDSHYTGTNGKVKTAEGGNYQIIIGGEGDEENPDHFQKTVEITATCAGATCQRIGVAVFEEGKLKQLYFEVNS